MRKPWLPLLVLLLAAFALRIYGLPQLSLRGDEAATLFAVQRPWGEFARAISQPSPHQPLYYLLLYGWTRLAGTSELAARYLTLTIGLLLVALVYAFGRRIFPQRPDVALWAMWLAAINPMLVWDAQDNRMYPLLFALSLSSFYFCLRLLERPDRRSWLGYVGCAALAFYTHYMALFVILAENLVFALYWVRAWRERSTPKLGVAEEGSSSALRLGVSVVHQSPSRMTAWWFGAQLAVGALVAPWFLRQLSVVTGFSAEFVVRAGLPDMLRRTLIGLSLGLSVDSRSGLYLALGFLVAAAAALAALIQQHSTRLEQVGTLVIYLLCPLICIMLFSWLRFPIFDERYILLSFPAYAVLLGYGLAALGARGWSRWLAGAALLWITLSSLYSLRNYHHAPRYMKAIPWRAYVNRLLACAQPGDLLIQNYPDPALTYHLRERLPRVLLPASAPMDEAATVDKLARLAGEYRRIWLQPQRYPGWDHLGLVKGWLDRRAYPAGEERFGSARLALYLPPTAFREAASPIRGQLGEQIELLAYLAEPVAGRARAACLGLPGERTLRPGQSLSVGLLWRARTRPFADYTVFVHLYDADMRLIAQQDGQPALGSRPTGTWQPGEAILDHYILALPRDAQPGKYRLGVGLYLLSTGERLPAYRDGMEDPARILWLQEIAILGE